MGAGAAALVADDAPAPAAEASGKTIGSTKSSIDDLDFLRTAALAQTAAEKDARPSSHRSDDLSLFKAASASSKEGDIRTRVATAEAAVATMDSGLATLENQVKGTAAALLQGEAAESSSSEKKGTSLVARVGHLEQQVIDMSIRMSNLEHTVVG
jgi:hypothetical protein